MREIEGGQGGHGPPNILAMPRLKSSGKVVTSLDFKMRRLDKVSRQILKAMQIPEAHFLIINAHLHRKMKGKKPRLGNFFFGPPNLKILSPSLL